jgi:hypothetical protein
MAKQELRMMKNRESAARSRLRRQQHTAQLEQENEQLQAEIDSLKAQVGGWYASESGPPAGAF